MTILACKRRRRKRRWQLQLRQKQQVEEDTFVLTLQDERDKKNKFPSSNKQVNANTRGSLYKYGINSRLAFTSILLLCVVNYGSEQIISDNSGNSMLLAEAAPRALSIMSRMATAASTTTSAPLVKSARMISYSLSCPPEARIHPCTCVHYPPSTINEEEEDGGDEVYEIQGPTPQSAEPLIMISSTNEATKPVNKVEGKSNPPQSATPSTSTTTTTAPTTSFTTTTTSTVKPTTTTELPSTTTTQEPAFVIISTQNFATSKIEDQQLEAAATTTTTTTTTPPPTTTSTSAETTYEPSQTTIASGLSTTSSAFIPVNSPITTITEITGNDIALESATALPLISANSSGSIVGYNGSSEQTTFRQNDRAPPISEMISSTWPEHPPLVSSSITSTPLASTTTITTALLGSTTTIASTSTTDPPIIMKSTEQSVMEQSTSKTRDPALSPRIEASSETNTTSTLTTARPASEIINPANITTSAPTMMATTPIPVMNQTETSPVIDPVVSKLTQTNTSQALMQNKTLDSLSTQPLQQVSVSVSDASTTPLPMSTIPPVTTPQSESSSTVSFTNQSISAPSKVTVSTNEEISSTTIAPTTTISSTPSPVVATTATTLQVVTSTTEASVPLVQLNKWADNSETLAQTNHSSGPANGVAASIHSSFEALATSGNNSMSTTMSSPLSSSTTTAAPISSSTSEATTSASLSTTPAASHTVSPLLTSTSTTTTTPRPGGQQSTETTASPALASTSTVATSTTTTTAVPGSDLPSHSPNVSAKPVPTNRSQIANAASAPALVQNPGVSRFGDRPASSGRAIHSLHPTANSSQHHPPSAPQAAPSSATRRPVHHQAPYGRQLLTPNTMRMRPAGSAHHRATRSTPTHLSATTPKINRHRNRGTNNNSSSRLPSRTRGPAAVAAARSAALLASAAVHPSSHAPLPRRRTRFLTQDSYLSDSDQPKPEVVAYCRNIQNPEVLKEAIKGFRGHQVSYFLIDSCRVPSFPNDLFDGIDVRWVEMSNSTVQFHNNFLHPKHNHHHHHD